MPAGAANARDVAMAPSAVVSVSDDDAPLVKANGASNGHARAPSDDDAPLALPRPKPAAKKPKKASGKASSSKKKTTDPDEDMSDGADDESFEDDDDAPLQPKPKKAAAPKVKAPSAPPVKLKATPKPKLKKEESIDVASPAKKPVAKGKGKAKKEGDEEDGDSDASDVHRWWDEQADSHGVKVRPCPAVDDADARSTVDVSRAQWCALPARVRAPRRPDEVQRSVPPPVRCSC